MQDETAVADHGPYVSPHDVQVEYDDQVINLSISSAVYLNSFRMLLFIY